MRDLEEIRAGAAEAIDRALRDLEGTARALAYDDPRDAVCLARVMVLLGSAVARAPIVTTSGLRPARDTPDSYLLAAARLHDALSDVGERLTDLWYGALDAKTVPVPDATRVLPSDLGLFRHTPAGDSWLSPFAVAHIEGLGLRDRPEARARRAAIVEAYATWCVALNRAEIRSGFVPLEECSRAVGRALRDLRAGMTETPTSSLAGARVKARASARALVEAGDDASDLVGLVRGYVAEREADDVETLAWDVVGSVLAAAPRG